MSNVVPARIDLDILQGTTFRPQFYWAGALVAKAIQSVTTGCPTSFGSTTHGLPAQPVNAWFQSVGGLGINTDSAADLGKAKFATEIVKVDANTFRAPLLNTSGETYTTGGVVFYNTPTDFTGYTARLHIRARHGEDPDEIDPLVELTTENGGIELGTTDGGIALYISAEDTAALAFRKAVYDLELIDADDNVDRYAFGNITVSREVTV